MSCRGNPWLTRGGALILRCAHLSRHPGVFLGLTGLRVHEFDALVAELLPGYAAGERARLQRPPRRRAVGAGRRFALRPRDRLLVAVVWLRQYPTHEVLGYLFGVSDTTVTRTIARWVPLLEAAGRATMHLPDPGKKRRRHLGALLADTPELAVIIDTFEQRVQRPRGRDAADALYSGKKRQHTLKSQLTINEITGEIADVAASAPGPTADIALVERSGVLPRLPPGVGPLGDLAYVGRATLHPQGAAPDARRAGRRARRRPWPTTAPSPGGGSRSSTPSGSCAATSASVSRIATIGATIPLGCGRWPAWSTAGSAASSPPANASRRNSRAPGQGPARPAPIAHVI